MTAPIEVQVVVAVRKSRRGWGYLARIEKRGTARVGERLFPIVLKIPRALFEPRARTVTVEIPDLPAVSAEVQK